MKNNTDLDYFLQTERIGFSIWRKQDTENAFLLWGNNKVTRFISASGTFSENEVKARLQREIDEYERSKTQYWPIFKLSDGSFIGCCGLHPYKEGVYELGFHLRPEYWGQGYATEAARAVISFAFDTLCADALFAGHNPKNTASKNVLLKLCFKYIGDNFYEPTGLYHPSYILEKNEIK